MIRDARQAALDAFAAGLSVLPPKEDGSKAPSGQWLQYQTERASIEQIQAWYGMNPIPSRSGCGLVCGAVSGGLECIEFDAGGRLYEHYKATARALGHGDLIDRLDQGYLEQSPTGGYHWLYRCAITSGNTKLAIAADKQSLIETRGEGGYIIVAPSNGKVHKNGAYVLLSGGFATIPVITPEERLTLWDIARLFDEPVADRVDPWVMKVESIGNTSPWDEYNARTTWRELLIEHGWTHVFTRDEVQYWRRPGKDHSHSATVNHGGTDRLKCFSSSCEFDNSPGVTYSRFGAYAVWEHGGDWRAAVQALKKAIKTERAKPKPPPPGTRLIEHLDQIEPKEVIWLWKDRIPKGFITIFFGTTGVGKSAVALDIAARLSRGDAWPDSPSERCHPGSTLIISEDPLEYMVVPRLIEMGAVVKRTKAFTWEAMQSWVLDDVETLERAYVEAGQPDLIIIDPPTNFIGDIDEHKNTKVRAVLMKLVIWLNQKNPPSACILITHCKKPSSEELESIYKMIGSIAWGSTARIAHALANDPDDETRKLFACSKSNICKIPNAFAYRIVEGKYAKVEWLVEVDVTADSILKDGLSKGATIDAVEWLTDRFREQRKWISNELKHLAKLEGYADNAISKNKMIRALIKEKKIKTGQLNIKNGDRRHYWEARPGWPPEIFCQVNRPESAESAESEHVSPCSITTNRTFGSDKVDPKVTKANESEKPITFGTGSPFGSDTERPESANKPYEITVYDSTFGTFGTFGLAEESENQVAFAIEFLVGILMNGGSSRANVEWKAAERKIPEEDLARAVERLEVERTWMNGSEFWELKGRRV